MKTQSTDTSPEAEAFLIQAIRRQTVAERIARVFELNQLCRLFALADLRRIYPNADERELHRRLAERILPMEIVAGALDALDAREKHGTK